MGCSGSCSSCSEDDGGCDRLPPGMLRNYDINESIADGVLVWVEFGSEGPSRGSMELLSSAKAICEGRVFAVLFGGPELKSHYPTIFGAGADTIYHVRDGRLDTYVPEAYASCIADIIARVSPATVLFSASLRGREVAPRLAAMLGTGLVADCTGMTAKGRDVVFTRPAFRGKLMADIRCTQFPQIATVRPGTFPLSDIKEGQGTAIYWQYDGDVSKEVVSDTPSPVSDVGVLDADVILAVGNGIRDKETLELAQKVADKLGAILCCSRPLVEKGWMPRSRQIGLSGHTVKPKLYLAFGISGAVQHIVGMSQSTKVIAVNNDSDAPIHGYADLSLITDATEVLKSMYSKL